LNDDDIDDLINKLESEENPIA